MSIASLVYSNKRFFLKEYFPQEEKAVKEEFIPSQSIYPTNVEEHFLDPIQERIVVTRREELLKYLYNFPDVIPLLYKAICKLETTFEPKCEIELTLFSDPEEEDSFPVLIVRSFEYNDEFLEKIEEISRLFDDELSKIEGFFTITTDFEILE